MTSLTVLDHQAREAYDSLAPAYDLLTAAYPYARWLELLEQLALDHGLRGSRVLDVACGTGKSFLRFHERDYQVTACDVSARMLARARRKAPGVRLEREDMRDLPVLGSFDLVTCLDDALNYMLEEDALAAALRGIACNLDQNGLAIWDLNTLAQYRGQFAQDHIVLDARTYVGWRSAHRAAVASADTVVEIALDVFTRSGGLWRRATSVHRQRHWSREATESACAAAGLEVINVRGQRPGAELDDHLDELTHTKAIYVARRR